jgi:cystathionine beta-lyase/cystathionine gamma-synthase
MNNFYYIKLQKKVMIMNQDNLQNFLKNIINSMPSDWLNLTTHRIDIYNEKRAKIEFLEEFEKVNISDKDSLAKLLSELPTAFDYIRLGHPLSCILEWAVASLKKLDSANVISFASQTMPVLSILRKNLLDNIKTKIFYTNELPGHFDVETLKDVYGFKFDILKIKNIQEITKFEGSSILITELKEIWAGEALSYIDFLVCHDEHFGSVALVVNDKKNKYISEIQHVRRRESIAMTPRDCFILLNDFIGVNSKINNQVSIDKNTSSLYETVKGITNTSGDASIGSSGLSTQYAIMMGLIHSSNENHKDHDIKFIVPPNCYGGTNDQARRVAACIDNVEIIDLPVDGGKDMVDSIEAVLEKVAGMDAVPFIIAEIPTNPRVEIPDLERLRQVLSKIRKTKNNNDSISPVFILDQTFCPNVKFLGEGDYLSAVETISYVSGSKFPSGGLCTAGYCVANEKAKHYMSYIDNHLKICGNQRIFNAYENTRSFVNHIKEVLPEAKINFVSEDLAALGFTPSVFSLDLPTRGDTEDERESYKREKNLKLINLMINEIPNESKHCVSYGQLKGCYWTIPATSTQGTTQEGDKDYIVRVAVSPDFDLEKHKKVFSYFCEKFLA